ncbi:MAG: hypothetical protein HY851_08675 [candidate division Zixibacteria bacterium]|nr:hypothetical protein [candidate division Zixibacteria bacterium]
MSARRSVTLLLAIAFAVTCQSPAVAGPGYIRGSYTAELYSYDDGSEAKWDQYHRIGLTLTKPLTGRDRYWGIGLNERIRVFEDRKILTLSQHVYEGNIVLHNLLNRTIFTVGQQFVYNTLGSSHLNGVRLQYAIFGKLRADVFGGREQWFYDIARSYNPTYQVWGARLSGDATSATQVGGNWMLRRTGGREVYHRAGLDLTHRLRKSELYGRGGWNLLTNRIADLLGRVTVTPKDWYASGEFHWREPNVAANSIFSVIAYDHYKRARIEVRRRLTNQLWVYKSAHATFVQGGTIWLGTLGITGPGYSIGWSHQEGRGTKSDGLTGSVAADLKPNWTVFGSSNLSRYRVQGEQADESDAYATSAGIGWRPARGWQVQVQGQWLRNAVRTSDVRFLFQLTKAFSTTIGGKGAGK